MYWRKSDVFCFDLSVIDTIVNQLVCGVSRKIRDLDLNFYLVVHLLVHALDKWDAASRNPAQICSDGHYFRNEFIVMILWSSCIVLVAARVDGEIYLVKTTFGMGSGAAVMQPKGLVLLNHASLNYCLVSESKEELYILPKVYLFYEPIHAIHPVDTVTAVPIPVKVSTPQNRLLSMCCYSPTASVMLHPFDKFTGTGAVMLAGRSPSNSNRCESR